VAPWVVRLFFDAARQKGVPKKVPATVGGGLPATPTPGTTATRQPYKWPTIPPGAPARNATQHGDANRRA